MAHVGLVTFLWQDKRNLFSLIVFCFAFNLYSDFTLMTSLYNEKHHGRAKEYLNCLRKNLKHPLISKIIIFYDISKNDEQNYLLKKLKRLPVQIIYLNRRPSFGDFFEEINFFEYERKVIIANGDIYFNETLHYLVDYDFNNKFLALTRWNDDGQGNLNIYKHLTSNGVLKDCEFSQDAWIFKTPLAAFQKNDIYLGLPACDLYIAYEAKVVGLEVLNPCLTIQSCHLHNVNIRNYVFEGYDKNRAIKELKWSKL